LLVCCHGYFLPLALVFFAAGFFAAGFFAAGFFAAGELVEVEQADFGVAVVVPTGLKSMGSIGPFCISLRRDGVGVNVPAFIGPSRIRSTVARLNLAVYPPK
jgi:hypothetical protein